MAEIRDRRSRYVARIHPVKDPRIQVVSWSKRAVTWAGLIGFSLLFLFPLFWMIITSLKETREATMTPPLVIPSEFMFQNYPKAIDANQGMPFYVYLGNTLYLTVLNLVGTLISCSLAAYGFSRIKWPGRDMVFVITLATMMIPVPVLMIPLYSMFQDIGWVGTFLPLWVPSFFGTAYFIFLLRQFFLTIPKDLSEAARIDGCNEFRIFWQIILPLSKPALLVVAMFSYLYVWNDLIGPLVYLTDPSQYTLAIGLQDFANQQGGSPYNLLMAAAVLVTIPVIIIYFFVQNAFTEGISLTGLKH